MFSDSKTDPCSLSYERSEVVDCTAVKSDTVKVSRVGFRIAKRGLKVRNGRMGFFKSVKKMFGMKLKKTVVNSTTNGGSPQRSRLPATKAAPEIDPVPIPTLTLSYPTTARTSTTYRVHSYNGEVSPPAIELNKVRFSHPVVSERPRTAATQSSEVDIASGMTESEIDQLRPETSASNMSMLNTVSSTGESGGSPPLDVKKIWQSTNQSVENDEVHETYGEFKDRLDGHKPRADPLKVSARPPTLQYIPRLASIKLFDEVDTKQKRSSLNASTEAANHRSHALSALEGLSAPASGPYVPAVLPKEHMPNTAVQVSVKHLPASLVPGAGSNTRSSKYRPYTYATPTPFKYKAYSPKAASIVPDIVPTFTDTSDRANKYLDVPNFEGTEFNKRHAQLYKTVESGVFDDLPAVTEIVAPKPHAAQTSNTFLLPPTPPPSPPLQKRTRDAKATSVPNLAVDLTKPLPSTPMAKHHQSGRPVTPLSMVGHGGYPFMLSHPSKRFSTEPKYQRRTINDVEAEFLKGEMAKKTKAEKSLSKQQKQKQKQTELEALDAQVKKLIGA